MKSYHCFIYLIVGLFVSCSPELGKLNQERNNCVLSGQIIDRSSDTLVLVKYIDRGIEDGIIIPIENNQFEYRLSLNALEKYKLIFKDEYDNKCWCPIAFYPDNDTIKFVLYPQNQREKSQVFKSNLMDQEDQLRALQNDLFKDKIEFWRKEWREAEYGTKKSYESRRIFSSLSREKAYWTLNYLKKSIDIFGYSKYMEVLERYYINSSFPTDTLKKYYNIYSQEFPDHPYTQQALKFLEREGMTAVGDQFEDFYATDLEGNRINSADIIRNNKYTLVEFTYPSKHSSVNYFRSDKMMLEYHERFKHKGLGICSVINDLGNSTTIIKQYVREKQTQPSFLILDKERDKETIHRYRFFFGGTTKILLDRKGGVVAVNPIEQQLDAFFED